MMLLFLRNKNYRRINSDLSCFKKLENIRKRRGFVNCLTDKCTSCILDFPKFEAVKVSFPNCLKFFGSYFHEADIVKKHFHFQKGFKFPRLAKMFGNVFQTSEVQYVTVMPVVSNKWNI